MLKFLSIKLPIQKTRAVSFVILGVAAFFLHSTSHAQFLTHTSVASAPLVDVTFKCHVESNGTRSFALPGNPDNKVLAVPCAYRLYLRQCQHVSKPERPEQSCRATSLMEFKLGPGEEKKVSNLPSGYKSCVGVGTPLPLDKCVQSSSMD
jgi:hypothetical protein